MTELAVVVPFASTCPHRRANLERVRAWYADRFPGAPIIVEDDGGVRSGWTKARAIERGLARTDARVIVVADSDCLADTVVDAARAVLAGEHRWAFPHRETRRLTPAATLEVLAGADPTPAMPVEVKPYRSVAGGGICVIARDTWDVAPMDPRFKVTHGEDVAWARALGYLCGRPWFPGREHHAPLYHLWHPPILALGARFKANETLAREYRAATGRTIGEVLDRARGHVDPPPVRQEPRRGDIAVIVPVLRRPAAAAPFLASWRATDTGRSHVYAIADPDDRATIDAWRVGGATVLLGDRGTTYACKVNYGLEATTEPWLLLLGDDVRFHRGWDIAALAAGQVAPVVSTNDLGRQDLDQLAVHPMFRRDYLLEQGASFDGPGLIAHEGYRHWYVDREWSYLAIDRNALVYAEDARIEHLHPIHGKAELDDVYRLGQAAARADERLFTMRRRLYDRRYPKELRRHA